MKIKSDFYWCINNDFELRLYPDTQTNMKLTIKTKYYVSVCEDLSFADIYSEKHEYIGWCLLKNINPISKYFADLATLRAERIDQILEDE
jgi:hypothetical protein